MKRRKPDQGGLGHGALLKAVSSSRVAISGGQGSSVLLRGIRLARLGKTSKHTTMLPKAASSREPSSSRREGQAGATRIRFDVVGALPNTPPMNRGKQKLRGSLELRAPGGCEISGAIRRRSTWAGRNGGPLLPRTPWSPRSGTSPTPPPVQPPPEDLRPRNSAAHAGSARQETINHAKEHRRQRHERRTAGRKKASR
jgi:hypothetical protein